ncbi:MULTISPECIES: PTS sugar transporter subunit IIC [unclassified Brenneria]|uniref:PTS sugar transporter subunit IIC n=1 Tax=unclassified Brenneria TaxID=2634434 RepID=UPI001556C6F9|nr:MULTISPECIES: PTS sugar transporter subunit IIC [unclassified Brenneria]MBJ7220365.1 PTS sugar transporter subunit IIC [Brenneria sp. L3-3C-1]MEE3641610.1 PTS sugar transporter subunit IIC [Brenneria sp. L3_3C_1]MEE3649759.1 PTS sugar transporter subunit IIC [Brenneria sp. HEZEL_4_2_4]NPC99718.1 PTS sugar transporter subunit IIC [Brenneria sp. hezel4-2-4]
MSFLNFIVHDVLGQASILVSLIAMIGLIALKKSPGQVITGTLKTLLGFLVLLAGANIIVATLTFLGDIFQQGFNMRGVVTDVGAIAGIAQQTLGRETALIMVIAFVVNIAIARFTRHKYIFLTGQASLWMATVCSVIGYMGGLRGVELILLGGVIAGMMAVLMPAMAQPIVRKITGSDDIALGHFCTIGYIVQAGVAKVTGDASKSTEDLELPPALSFLQDTYLSMMVVMIPIYLIPAIAAGPEVVAASSNGVNYLVYAFIQSIQFVVGVYVLLAGVRLLLAEIVPAFRGIALRIVPNAVPALDCPVLFPYAPNAVIIGFISTTVGAVIGMFLFPTVGLAMILPGMLTNFFAGGTAGIFANAVGGRRGAIIGGVFHGLFITLLPALLLPLLGSFGLENVTFSDSDVISVGLVFGYILNFFQ